MKVLGDERCKGEDDTLSCDSFLGNWVRFQEDNEMDLIANEILCDRIRKLA